MNKVLEINRAKELAYTARFTRNTMFKLISK